MGAQIVDDFSYTHPSATAAGIYGTQLSSTDPAGYSAKYCQLCMKTNRKQETMYASHRDVRCSEPKTSPRTSVSSMIGARMIVTNDMARRSASTSSPTVSLL